MNSAHGWAGSETFTGQNWLILSSDATIGSLKAADLFALDISGGGRVIWYHPPLCICSDNPYRVQLITCAVCWLLAYPPGALANSSSVL
jgi:hypothetical protein